MNASATDRRHRRSEDAVTALHYQLAHARKEGAFDALVLVDGGGALVAGAGAWPVCEELAAFTPLLARRCPRSNEVGLAVEALRGQVLFRVMDVDGAEVFLAARTDRESPSATELLRAAAGCLRILGVGVEAAA
jgi:hypothetical protein